MSASGKKPDSQEVMPLSLVDMIPSGVKEYIYDYSDANPGLLEQPATFFGLSPLRKQILALAEYAGPLGQIEMYIRQAHAKKEPQLQAILTQAINLAIIGLDYTVQDDRGMAEALLNLHAELFPDMQRKALEQVKLAAPLEDEKESKAREENNLLEVNRLFDAFVKEDKRALAVAINQFNKCIENTKPKIITDNRYYLDLMHFLCVAFDVINIRGHELPRIKGDKKVPIDRKWEDEASYGKLAQRFCIQIIGVAIESRLPQRIKQILRGGVYRLFHLKQKANRELDVSGALFKDDGRNHLHGINSYYDELGPNRESEDRFSMDRSRDDFKRLYRVISESASMIYKSAVVQLNRENDKTSPTIVVTTAAKL